MGDPDGGWAGALADLHESEGDVSGAEWIATLDQLPSEATDCIMEDDSEGARQNLDIVPYVFPAADEATSDISSVVPRLSAGFDRLLTQAHGAAGFLPCATEPHCGRRTLPWRCCSHHVE